MEKYRIWFSMHGFVDVAAESEDEAYREFDGKTQNELMKNLFVTELGDIQSLQRKEG